MAIYILYKLYSEMLAFTNEMGIDRSSLEIQHLGRAIEKLLPLYVNCN